MNIAFVLFLNFLLLNSQKLEARTSCAVRSSSGTVIEKQNDEFYRILSQSVSCPQNIDQVNQLLDRTFENRKFLVANRGRNNSKLGSFSIFESFARSERKNDVGIFLGHFTHLQTELGRSSIDLDQKPQLGKLIIELIAWDSLKGYYNFYELIGQGQMSQWFYRGDSRDILLDNQFIYLNNTPQNPPVGNRLRCSGCHISGGPIMKELTYPHNDWWLSSRPLLFQSPHSQNFLKRLQVMDSAENLSVLVQAGIQKLESSANYQAVKKSLGLKAQLRPLFCDLEINIESDKTPFEKSLPIKIPTMAWAGPFAGVYDLTVTRSVYNSMLSLYRMQFPETKNADSDHSWLAPVKGYSDLVAVNHLKLIGLLDDKTILDVYLSAPIGSLMNQDRCSLLKLVPESLNWKPGFLEKLKFIKTGVAQNMFLKMNDASLTPKKYQSALNQWSQQVHQKLAKGEVKPLFSQLLANRQSVSDSEISKNPRGQILEPGFRVIFPLPTNSSLRITR